jgi:ornithine cyclodeaminase
MKIIEAEEVFSTLTMEKCIPLMRQTLADLAAGKYLQPMRSILSLPGGDSFGFMPAWLGPGDYFGAKIITAFHKNLGTEYPSHMGYVMLFESEHGSPVAMVDASAITQIRTGAVSGAATDLLARRDASALAIIGTGAQGRSHFEAMNTIRKIESLKVYDINPSNAERFAAEIKTKYRIEVQLCASVREAVLGADIICTVTPSKEPLLFSDMVKDGAHVNAVGTFSPTTREAASDLVVRARLYADHREALLRESGEFLIPKSEGLINEDHIKGSLGDLVNGNIKGRESETDVTLFDALGLACEDVAAAKFVFLESSTHGFA